MYHGNHFLVVGGKISPPPKFATLLYIFSINCLIQSWAFFRANWMIPPFKISRWKSTATDCREMLPLIWKPTSDKMGQPKFGGETTKQKPFGEWCWSCCNNLRHGITYVLFLLWNVVITFIELSVILKHRFSSCLSSYYRVFCILYWCPTNTSTKKKSPKQSHRCRCASCPWRYTG